MADSWGADKGLFSVQQQRSESVIGVVMLVNEFPPLPVGGAEKQAERLSEQLGMQGLRVGVLTRGAEGLPYTSSGTDTGSSAFRSAVLAN